MRTYARLTELEFVRGVCEGCVRIVCKRTVEDACPYKFLGVSSVYKLAFVRTVCFGGGNKAQLCVFPTKKNGAFVLRKPR